MGVQVPPFLPIYRFLDTLSLNLKDKIEQCIFEYTSMVTGGIRVSFYDVTTLYFEAAKIGLNRTTMQELDRTQKRSLTGQ